MTTLTTKVLGIGLAAIVSAYVPDMDYFCGRGGKDIIPLYRDSNALEPNVTSGLLELLERTYGTVVSPENLMSYTYGILANPAYVEKFSEELTLPGPRLPITQNPNLFREVAAIGQKLIHWHTYAERLSGSGIPKGSAKNTIAVPSDSANYPNSFGYVARTQTLHVGVGEFAPVTPEVFGFSVSGLEIVKSWLGYRMYDRAGKKSSPLDDIRPSSWTFEMTKELLELLWVLEATIQEFPRLAALLEQACTSEVFLASDLPMPQESERKAPINEEVEPEDQAALLEL